MTIAYPILALTLLTVGVCLWAYWPAPELCQVLHPHSTLRRSITGRPGWICEECGAAYFDLHDAGRIPVVPDDLAMALWTGRRLPLHLARRHEATFVAREFNVRRSA